MALTKVFPRMIEGVVISVKDFGAVGDGVTDDTAAIQAAIDNADAGSTVYVPVGTYIISSAINLSSRIRLRGDGYTRSTINQSNRSEDIIKIRGFYCQLDNIELDNGSNGVEIGDTTSGQANYATLKNVRIDNCVNNGIYHRNGNFLWAQNVLIEDCDTGYLNTNETQNKHGNTWIGMSIFRCTSYGFRLQNPDVGEPDTTGCQSSFGFGLVNQKGDIGFSIGGNRNTIYCYSEQATTRNAECPSDGTGSKANYVINAHSEIIDLDGRNFIGSGGGFNRVLIGEIRRSRESEQTKIGQTISRPQHLDTIALNGDASLSNTFLPDSPVGTEIVLVKISGANIQLKDSDGNNIILIDSNDKAVYLRRVTDATFGSKWIVISSML